MNSGVRRWQEAAADRADDPVIKKRTADFEHDRSLVLAKINWVEPQPLRLR
jgi:hypothetical protein